MNKAPLENLRGDYAGMAPDWTVPQHADLYSDEDQAVWRLLVERQTALARAHACEEFLQGLQDARHRRQHPRLRRRQRAARAADRLAHRRRAGPDPRRRLLRSPGASPLSGDGVDPQPCRARLSGRARPVPRFLRPRAAARAIRCSPTTCRLYGQRGVEAGAKIDLLARLYWYTVEFGLIRTPKGLKAYGAGILSSAAEVKHAIEGKDVERLPFEAATVMRRPYEIDKLQNTYFVLDDFRQLFEAAQTRVA